MTENRVMKLWTAIVTAFLALCTALGFAASSGTAAAAQTGPTHTGSESSGSEHTAATSPTTADPAAPAAAPWDWAHTRSLPPTMKQRIRAEAHGKSPNCRHRPLEDTDQAAEHTTSTCGTSTDLTENAEPSIPLQR